MKPTEIKDNKGAYHAVPSLGMNKECDSGEHYPLQVAQIIALFTTDKSLYEAFLLGYFQMQVFFPFLLLFSFAPYFEASGLATKFPSGWAFLLPTLFSTRKSSKKLFFDIIPFTACFLLVHPFEKS